MKLVLIAALSMFVAIALLLTMTPLGAVAGESVHYLAHHPLVMLPAGFFAAIGTFGVLPAGWNAQIRGRVALR